MQNSNKESDFIAGWLAELASARQREKDFRRVGHEIVGLYEAAKKEQYQFNILYSNTETLSPALYNSTPRPQVQRRFKDSDPLGAAAAKAGQRLLEYLLDDGSPEYPTFDELLKSSVLEGLVPGRGLTRFKYDATIVRAQNDAAADKVEDAQEISDEGEETPELDETEPQERVDYETVCGEEVPWDRFLHGYAKKWKDVPWIAYEHFMTREELEQNFGAIGAVVPVAALLKENGDEEDASSSRSRDGMEGVKVAHVYEVWDKTRKTVFFISPNYKDNVLKSVQDPLGLSGFFNCPKPLRFMARISSLTPVALYAMYEEQAKELNRITIRINKIVNALKVRGFYDSTIEGLAKVFEADDNTLIPADNVAGLIAQGNSLEKSVWLAPIEKLVPVLQQLYTQRAQVKQVIFEITGIADIMRGSTQASETLGAQEIKNQWGTLRLKRMQKEVARYACDSLRIMLEIAVHKLSIDTIKAMTGLPFPMEAEKQQAQMALQQMAQMGQQPPPALVEASQQPSWEQIVSLLQNDLQRNYRIDIETNSTVDAEATEDKQNIAELLNAISQFLNGVSPLIESGSMPFDVAKGMLLAIVRRFRFGPELEEQLKAMQPPQPKSDPKADTAAEASKIDLQMKQLEMQQRQAEHQANMVAMQREAEFRAAEHQQRMQELQAKGQLALLTHSTKLREMQMQAAMPQKPAGVKGK